MSTEKNPDNDEEKRENEQPSNKEQKSKEPDTPQELALIDRLRGNNWVQKSDPLMLLRHVPLSLGELKLLDTYISRINSHDETKRLVKFSVKEYEKLMGLKQLNQDSLKNNLTKLQDKKIEIDVDNQWVKINLFQLSGFVVDEYGEGYILLECTDRAKDLFFNLKHYIKYQLKYVLPLTSLYSYAFYLYIKKNSFRGTWTISVDELRDDVFCAEDIPTYQEFKNFNSKIIKKAVQEVNELTDAFVDYTRIKKGKNIVAIQFSYQQNPRLNTDEIEGQLTINDFIDTESAEEDPNVLAEKQEQFDKEMEEEYGEHLVGYAKETEYIFDSRQIEVLHDLVGKIDPPADPLISGTLGKWYGYYSYLGNMYKRMLIAESKSLKERGKGIKDKFEYLRKMLENELKKQEKD